ncbi:hypothetical protein Tco_1274679, partial [Tanacetum coccineum]
EQSSAVVRKGPSSDRLKLKSLPKLVGGWGGLACSASSAPRTFRSDRHICDDVNMDM